ncbi:UDP-N-acetylmuramoyl-tripeptide--D-alanyl-D-alanine ligase [Cobetia amphilecti]|uniref:UDP-N-acetylmuramoyl-tripeptide--D-alanyl-D- alanine ligase n=1 Tax=Cobetia amphilecti TaxID=1055104 RepID=UPI0026E2B8E6|nr:UDP-N-acetylmuramoyl-tripeptide--D-alanyl-D-alanine ligase [Cobetia amphilecti]MDO6817071.1 UDP-N-acetylmuramoyl-tripeptide--D-alanyl-D-alanine ligase [Cobetia amphilecti]
MSAPEQPVGLSTFNELAAVLGAQLPQALRDQALGAIETDTRKLGEQAAPLFVALKGERFDAHDFLAQARANGAVAALVERAVDDPLPQIVVADTRLAFGLLAAARRRAWGRPLIAVTGNSGKTSVKGLVHAILVQDAARFEAESLANHGNLNNDFGLPMTLLRLSNAHQHGVVELGANHLGEIAWTTALARPQVAVITNVTGAHVGEFGGMGQIAQAKGEILAGLSPLGGRRPVAVLNRDDAYFSLWQALAATGQVVDVIDFSVADSIADGCVDSVDRPARLQARELGADELGRYAFELTFDGRSLGRVQLALLGRHNVANALAAAAACLALGIDSDLVIAGLESAESVPGRLGVVAGINGSRLLDDSYNANPGAMLAALDLLATLPAPRWCLMGAMGELGADAERLHAEVGDYARKLGIDFIATCGEGAQATAEAFGVGGKHFIERAELEAYARNHLPTGASVLVKGSRSAGMENVVAALKVDASR